MAKKRDDFAKISKDLEKSIQRMTGKEQALSKSIKYNSRQLKPIMVIVLLMVFGAFFWLRSNGIGYLFTGHSELASLKSAEDNGVDERLEHLRLKYLSKWEEYEFKWTIDDFERIPEQFPNGRPNFEDIISLYGRPNDISRFQLENEFVTFYYTALWAQGFRDISSPRVTLTFRMEEDRSVLQDISFAHFPIPQKYALHFKSDGERVTSQVAEQFVHRVGFDKGEALQDIQNTYAVPDYMLYSLDNYLGTNERIELVYYVREEGRYAPLEVLFRFRKDTDGHFALEFVQPK